MVYLFKIQNLAHPWKYQLIPEVWGTVSDWVMILVTCITAYLLWKTLSSQNKSIKIQNETLKEQQKITKFESHQYLEKIRPEFKLTYTANTPDEVRSTKTRLTFSFYFYIQNYHATNILITANREITSLLEGIAFPIEKERLNVGESISIILVEFENIMNHEAKGSPYFLNVEFNLKFNDIDGNKYSQKIIVFDVDGKDCHVENGPSKRIT